MSPTNGGKAALKCLGLLGLVIAVCIGIMNSMQNAQVSLEGRVLSTTTNQPIPNAIAVLHTRQAGIFDSSQHYIGNYSDINGMFRIASTGDRPVALYLSAPGYYPQTSSLVGPVEVKLVECVNSHLVEIEAEIKFAVNGSDDGFSFHERKMTPQSQADIQVFPAPMGNGSTWRFHAPGGLKPIIASRFSNTSNWIEHRIQFANVVDVGSGKLEQDLYYKPEDSAGAIFRCRDGAHWGKLLVESERQDTSGDRYLRIRYVLNEQGGYELGSECRKNELADWIKPHEIVNYRK